MAEIGIKNLKSGGSRIIDEAEDLVLANAEEYVTMRRRSREAYAKGRTRRLSELD